MRWPPGSMLLSDSPGKRGDDTSPHLGVPVSPTVIESNTSAALAGADVCRACGHDRLSLRFRVAGDPGEEGLIPTTDSYGVAMSDIVRCERCGHMQLAEMPADAVLAAAYEEAESVDYVEEEIGQRETARAILDAIERHRGPGRIADLGCWVGFLLSEAEGRGWEAVGVEPSEFASGYARDRLGLDVRTAGLFDGDLDEGSVDAVFMGDVIEHIPAADAAVDRARWLLRDGGVLVLALPDAGSRLARTMGRRWWSVLPTHVHYFTRHSITTMLERRGFDALEITTAPKTFSVGYYLNRLGGYGAALGRGLARAATSAGLDKRLWTPDFGDRMLVIARPRANPVSSTQ